MRVLICGSRTWSDEYAIDRLLDGLAYPEGTEDMVVIEGGASGADRMAADWAHRSYVAFEEYPADWKRHGAAAGPIRNQQMLDEGRPDVVWAFVDKPLEESRGTADMVQRSRKAGVLVYVVERVA